ncbi:MAG: Wzz/FepE/Etk N-terminal domain-containing protein [Bacteroidota bacterium]
MQIGSIQFDLKNAVPRIFSQWKKIIAYSFGATLMVAIYVFFIPNIYTAETTILPELEKNKMLGMISSLDLASATGLSLGETPVSKLYPLIIKSSRVLHEVIYTKYKTQEFTDSVDLIRFWKIAAKSEDENYEAALKILRNRMDVTFDNKLGTLIFKVDMEEPKLAADVANCVTRQLDEYTRKKRKTGVILQREFIEKRLQEIKAALETAEDSLTSFRSKNRRITDSPELMIDQERLTRSVQINSTIFIELTKQVEIAKIEEIKNIPIINILDEARIPLVKSYPHRLTTILWFFVVALMTLSLGMGFQPQLKSLYSIVQEYIPKNLSYAKEK